MSKIKLLILIASTENTQHFLSCSKDIVEHIQLMLLVFIVDLHQIDGFGLKVLFQPSFFIKLFWVFHHLKPFFTHGKSLHKLTKSFYTLLSSRAKGKGVENATNIYNVFTNGFKCAKNFIFL